MSSLNILLISPYSFDDYGGVQSQIAYSKEYLQTHGYNVNILAHKSNDYDIKKSSRIRFNGSVSNVSLTCDSKLINQAIHCADTVSYTHLTLPTICRV